jgi:hypothetical protein
MVSGLSSTSRAPSPLTLFLLPLSGHMGANANEAVSHGIGMRKPGNRCAATLRIHDCRRRRNSTWDDTHCCQNSISAHGKRETSSVTGSSKPFLAHKAGEGHGQNGDRPGQDRT